MRRGHTHLSRCLLISACEYSENIFNLFCLWWSVALGSKPYHAQSINHQSHWLDPLTSVPTDAELRTCVLSIVTAAPSWIPAIRASSLCSSLFFLSLHIPSPLFSPFFTESHIAEVGFNPHPIPLYSCSKVLVLQTCATTPGTIFQSLKTMSSLLSSVF